MSNNFSVILARMFHQQVYEVKNNLFFQFFVIHKKDQHSRMMHKALAAFSPDL